MPQSQGVLHGQVVGVEEGGILAQHAQLLADPAHHVHVGVVVELDGVADAELVVALLRREAVQVVTDFGLARGGQGGQQQDVDVLGHYRTPSCAKGRLKGPLVGCKTGFRR